MPRKTPTTPEEREAYRAYFRQYCKNRYLNDPIYKQKQIDKANLRNNKLRNRKSKSNLI